MKYFLIVFFFLFAPLTSAALLFNDTFDRANSATLGTADSGQTWVSGSFNITNGVATSSGAVGAYVDFSFINSSNTNVTVRFQIKTMSDPVSSFLEVKNGTSNNTLAGARFNYGATDSMQYPSNSLYPNIIVGINATTNVWYTVVLDDFNFASGTYDINLTHSNGSTWRRNNVLFYSTTQKGFSRIWLYTETTGTIQADNITITDSFTGINITHPTTESPKNVTAGNVLNVNFTFQINDSLITNEAVLNVTLITVGGQYCAVINDTIASTCTGSTPTCTSYASSQANCQAIGCSFAAPEVNSTLVTGVIGNGGFENTTGLINWSVTASGYTITTLQKNSGANSSTLAPSLTSKFIWHDRVNTTSCNTVYVGFYSRDDDLDATDVQLYYNDSSGNWDAILDLNVANGVEDTWIVNNLSTTDAQYLHSGFNIRFGGTTAAGEQHWVDDVTIICQATVNSCTGTANPCTTWASNQATCEVAACSYTASYLQAQYSCDAVNKCQINCTAPSGLSGLQDLNMTLNYTTTQQTYYGYEPLSVNYVALASTFYLFFGGMP